MLLIESARDQAQPDHVDREKGQERTEVEFEIEHTCYFQR